MKQQVLQIQQALDVSYYPSNEDTVLILIHGSGWHSRYFLPMARIAATENLAHVFTPDLRGHGERPAKRGDIDYIDQLEDDLADLISITETRHPGARIILGGHSSGGGLVIRFGSGRYGECVSSYLLLSLFLKYNAATMKPGSGGWAHANLPRIVGLSMSNNIGLRFLNGLDVIDFDMPETYRDGTETLAYSYSAEHRIRTQKLQKRSCPDERQIAAGRRYLRRIFRCRGFPAGLLRVLP